MLLTDAQLFSSIACVASEEELIPLNEFGHLSHKVEAIYFFGFKILLSQLTGKISTFVTAIKCANGTVLSSNASPCQPSCENPNADDQCTERNRAVCVCPSGRILFQGQCVSVCGCVDSAGVAHQVGSRCTNLLTDKNYALFYVISTNLPRYLCLTVFYKHSLLCRRILRAFIG
jgi:Trypsin Inhibitor like cysteine rich domain